MDQNSVLKDWREQVDYFKEHLEEIKEKYGEDTYVAIYKKDIIGSGTNRSNLLKRVKELHQNEVVLVQRYKDYDRIVDMPSPVIDYVDKLAKVIEKHGIIDPDTVND